MPVWNPTCDRDHYDEPATAEAVRLVCVTCADLYAALQAPADAMYTWLDQVRCRIFKKIDKAGDKRVIALLETAFAIRDKLGASGPTYPGAAQAAETPQDAGTASDAPSVSVDAPASPGADCVYMDAPVSTEPPPVDLEPPEATASATATTAIQPVDLDQPHVLKFAESAERWHKQLAAFYGTPMEAFLAALDMKSLAEAGEHLSRAAAAARGPIPVYRD